VCLSLLLSLLLSLPPLLPVAVPGAQGMLDVVSALAVDEELSVLVMGDSGGHLRTFDISRGINTCSRETTRTSFVEVRLQPSDHQLL